MARKHRSDSFEMEYDDRKSHRRKPRTRRPSDHHNYPPPKYSSPLKKHSCTDIICLVLFILFFGLLAFISVFAYLNGNPADLVLPHDSKGRICGKSDGLTEKPFLLFFDLTKCLVPWAILTGCPTWQVCVNKCPDTALLRRIPGHEEKLRPFCDTTDPLGLVKCPEYVVPSQALFGRCIPTIITASSDKLNDTIAVVNPTTGQSETILGFDGNSLTVKMLKEAAKYITDVLNLKNTFELVLEDFIKTYWLILIGLSIGALLALIWIFVLRYIVKPMVFLTLFLVLALLGAGTYFSVREYLDLNSKQSNSTDFKTQYEKMYDLNYLVSLKETWLVISIIAGLTFVILFILIMFLRNRIKLACELIKEASKAVLSIPASFIWPLVPFVLEVAVLSYCITTMLFLASSGIPLFKIVDVNANSTQDFSIYMNKNSEQKIVFAEAMRLLREEQKPENVDSNPAYLEYLRLNKDKYVPGVYCQPEEFYKAKNESIEQGNNTMINLECLFYKYGYNTTLKDYIKTDLLDEYNKYFSKGMEFINEHPWVLQLYVLFMLFWLASFVNGLNEMTLAGAFGAWYWTNFSNINKQLKNKLPFFTVLGSFARAFFFHFGTIAFGSLLIALLKIIRVILEYISNKVEKHLGEDSKIAKFIHCCCSCCFWCLERFLKFLNRNAYVVTAVYSLNFCRAASKAFKLIGANVIRVVVVDKISWFILFLSNLVIAGLVGVLAYFFFTAKIPIDLVAQYTPTLNYYFVPLATLVIGVFFISKMFFDVFSMGIDTLLMCVFIDLDINDGTRERPYFMSKNLRKVLKISNNRD